MSNIVEANMENLLRVIEEGNCPRFNHIPLLSGKAADILKDSLDIDVNQWGEDAMQLIINDEFYDIPRIMTSRGALDYLGLTKSRVQELWNLIKQVNSRFTYMSPINEFDQRMINFVDTILNSIKVRNPDGQMKSSVELLDAIGLTNDAQSRPLELTNLARLSGPVRIIQLRRINPVCVHTLARKYIISRWAFLQEMDELILNQKEGWWEKIVKEFTQSPIKSPLVNMPTLIVDP